MGRLRTHPVLTTVLAFTLAAAAVLAVAAAFGFASFARGWSHLSFAWLALAACAALMAFGAYAVAYARLARFEGGPDLAPPLLMRLVVAGFGPFVEAGGFIFDKRALRALGGDGPEPGVRVLGMGAVEWAVLAPAACVAAVVLLAIGDPRPMSSLLWPWALAVPAGFAIGLLLAAPARVDRICARGSRWRQGLGGTLRGVGIVRSMLGAVSSCWAVWTGMTLYWALDIASLYGSVRFVGLRPNLGEIILAYATGYALTRRSMPLGGAGVTEVLMTFALHWVGQPVAPALAGVVVYRVFNFAVPAAPALLVRRRLSPLVAPTPPRRSNTGAERRHAARGLIESGR